MSTERKFIVASAWVCIAVIIEGLLSAARYAVAGNPEAVVALVRVLLAWWIASAIAHTLKNNPEK